MQVSVSSGDVTGAASKTILSVLASASRRAKLKQIIISCTDSPADATAVFALRDITADGTGTGVTPRFVDRELTGQTPSCTAKANYTVEPTYATGNGRRIGLNQRIPLVYNPPYDGEDMTQLSSQTVVGFGLQMISGPPVKYDVNFQWDE